MTASSRSRIVGLVTASLLIAGGGWWLWQELFSRPAQIDAVYRACVAEFADVSGKMKDGVTAGEASPAIVKSLSERLGKWLGEMSSGMGDKVCATVREACEEDFQGRICVAARDRW